MTVYNFFLYQELRSTPPSNSATKVIRNQGILSGL